MKITWEICKTDFGKYLPKTENISLLSFAKGLNSKFKLRIFSMYFTTIFKGKDNFYHPKSNPYTLGNPIF